jgi:hypothetical protein
MDRAGLLFNSSRIGEGELWSVPKIIADAVPAPLKISL